MGEKKAENRQAERGFSATGQTPKASVPLHCCGAARQWPHLSGGDLL